MNTAMPWNNEHFSWGKRSYSLGFWGCAIFSLVVIGVIYWIDTTETHWTYMIRNFSMEIWHVKRMYVWTDIFHVFKGCDLHISHQPYDMWRQTVTNSDINQQWLILRFLHPKNKHRVIPQINASFDGKINDNPLGFLCGTRAPQWWWPWLDNE